MVPVDVKPHVSFPFTGFVLSGTLGCSILSNVAAGKYAVVTGAADGTAQANNLFDNSTDFQLQEQSPAYCIKATPEMPYSWTIDLADMYSIDHILILSTMNDLGEYCIDEHKMTNQRMTVRKELFAETVSQP